MFGTNLSTSRACASLACTCQVAIQVPAGSSKCSPCAQSASRLPDEEREFLIDGEIQDTGYIATGGQYTGHQDVRVEDDPPQRLRLARRSRLVSATMASISRIVRRSVPRRFDASRIFLSHPGSGAMVST